MKKVNKKILGILPPTIKSEVDGKLQDISLKTIPELLELRDRQLKLLGNKNFTSKLPDKGAKVQIFYDTIIATLKGKQDEEQTCSLLRELKLNPINKEAVQEVEWQGKLDSNKDVYLDSDDDSDPEDVMHILSQNTSLEKKLIILKPEKPSITTTDLIQIGDMPHVIYLVEKTQMNPEHKSTGQFKPFRTTKSDVHNPQKEILRKKHKHWEVTAATPPPIVNSPAKLLSLEESLKLQKDYNIHLKEIEAHHAAEKLMDRVGIKMANIPADVTKFGTYRNVESDHSDESDPEASDKEVHDEEPERGGVVFTVMN